MKHLATALAVAAIGVVAPVASASAAPPSVTVDPTVVTPLPEGDPNRSSYGANNLQVSGTGVTEFELIFMNICYKSITDPTFDPAFDCAAETGGQLVVDPGATSFTYTYTGAFYGDNPLGLSDLACAEPGYVSPNGYTRADNCWIRITKSTPNNTDDDVQVLLSYSGGPPPVIPEAPYAALLPLGALAVLGGGYLVLRNRRSGATA